MLLLQYEKAQRADFPGVADYISWHILREVPARRKKLYAKWDEGGWPDILMMSYQMFRKLRKKTYEKVKWLNGGSYF